MIVICELQCKAHSHEKFNCGFLHGLRLAYPQDKILFYADLSHISAIKQLLFQHHINIGNIEYIPIEFQAVEFRAWIKYYLLLQRIFSDVIAAGGDKLFILSFNSAILHIVKRLKQRKRFSSMKLTMVCHGEFEFIAPDRLERKAVERVTEKPFIEKIQKLEWREILFKIKKKIVSGIMDWYCSIVDGQFMKWFPLKNSLLWRPSGDFKYILLGPHIMANAKQYIDVKALDFHTVVLPTLFGEPLGAPTNKYVKFAVFGYGYSAMLQKVLAALSLKQLKNLYEIRIIGMDNSGTEGYPNVSCPSPGKPLPREEMERYVPDIDIFLILYDKSLYRLSCSGSIMEALSYMKPILHFDNDCINAFNKKENPIGISCDNVDGMATVMADIINNYTNYVVDFDGYRNNILAVREKVAVENNLQELRDAFTW